RSFISTNQELWRGDALLSNNGLYRAAFQDDGNFVLYKWTPIWASNTQGKGGTVLLLQGDSNLVIYNDGKPLWASDTWSNQSSQKVRLTVTDEGQLVMTRDSCIIWSAGEHSCPCK
uniref:Bulb-type lectin domain-containing protein n=1 Tax=Myripristis murdjan TaxID=586833 RepID=A0A667ZDX2_9TELE